ncbi:MAG: hypothetical protein IKV36_03135 [Clostridia bacterium]|nr:hypothetical protein [Clostridia bacterium]
MHFVSEFELRGNDFDSHGKLLASAILDMFQEAAGRHAEALGCGFETLREKGLLWVIIRSKFELLKNPPMHSTVLVKTWPLPPTKFSFRRDYLMTDKSGEILIKATSDWMIIDSNTRSFAKADKVYPQDKEFITDFAIDEKLKKLHFQGEASNCHVVTPSYCDIDRNGHVNNTKYPEYILNALDMDGLSVKSFQIDHHKEVLKGQKLTIRTSKNGETIFALGTNQQEEIMFVGKLEVQ